MTQRRLAADKGYRVLGAWTGPQYRDLRCEIDQIAEDEKPRGDETCIMVRRASPMQSTHKEDRPAACDCATDNTMPSLETAL